MGSQSHKQMQKMYEDEQMFQKWIRSLKWFDEYVAEHGEEPDINTEFYDYRMAWRHGIKPSYNKSDKRHHWPSVVPMKGEGPRIWLKDPEKHKTAWKQKVYDRLGIDPDTVDMRAWLPK